MEILTQCKTQIGPVLPLDTSDSYCSESLFHTGNLISWLYHSSLYILKHFAGMLAIILTYTTTLLINTTKLSTELHKLFFCVTELDSNAMLHIKPLILVPLKIRSVCHMVNLKFPQGKHFFIVNMSKKL